MSPAIPSDILSSTVRLLSHIQPKEVEIVLHGSLHLLYTCFYGKHALSDFDEGMTASRLFFHYFVP